MSTILTRSLLLVKSPSKTRIEPWIHASDVTCASSLPSQMSRSSIPPTVIRAHCSSRHQPLRWYVSWLHSSCRSSWYAGGAITTKNAGIDAYKASELIESACSFLLRCGMLR